jgi:hypothetical protein
MVTIPPLVARGGLSHPPQDSPRHQFLTERRTTTPGGAPWIVAALSHRFAKTGLKILALRPRQRLVKPS